MPGPTTKRVDRYGPPLICINCHEEIRAINEVREACTKTVFFNGRMINVGWEPGDVKCPHCGLAANRRMLH